MCFLLGSLPVYKQLIHSGGSRHVRYCNQNESIIATIGLPGHTLNVTNIKTKFPVNVAKLKVLFDPLFVTCNLGVCILKC